MNECDTAAVTARTVTARALSALVHHRGNTRTECYLYREPVLSIYPQFYRLSAWLGLQSVSFLIHYNYCRRPMAYSFGPFYDHFTHSLFAVVVLLYNYLFLKNTTTDLPIARGSSTVHNFSVRWISGSVSGHGL